MTFIPPRVEETCAAIGARRGEEVEVIAHAYAQTVFLLSASSVSTRVCASIFERIAIMCEAAGLPGDDRQIIIQALTDDLPLIQEHMNAPK